MLQVIQYNLYTAVKQYACVTFYFSLPKILHFTPNSNYFAIIKVIKKTYDIMILFSVSLCFQCLCIVAEKQ